MDLELQENLNRLLLDVAAPSEDCRRFAESIPLAVSFGIDVWPSTFREGARLPQREQVVRGLREAVDSDSEEARLGTEDDVFTYAGAFRYRPQGGDPAGGIGLIYAAEFESAAKGEKTATPFDSGAAFRYLRPKDSETEQVQFVRDHELPVPEYRQLLACYLDQYFDVPGAYLDDAGPSSDWPIPVQGGDARRWTFEVRFPKVLPVGPEVKAAFLPRTLPNDPDLLKQQELWRECGTEVRFYGGRRNPASFAALQNAGKQFMLELLEQEND